MYDIWAATNSVTYEVLSEPIRHSDAHKDRQTDTSKRVQTHAKRAWYSHLLSFSVKGKAIPDTQYS